MPPPPPSRSGSGRPRQGTAAGGGGSGAGARQLTPPPATPLTHIWVRSQASMQVLQKRCMQEDTARAFFTIPAATVEFRIRGSGLAGGWPKEQGS